MTASSGARVRATRAIILLAIVLSVAFALLGLLFSELSSEGQRTRELRALRDHSIETRAVLRRIFSALQDAEISERGFLLTQDPVFLEPYESTLRNLPGLLLQLRNLTTGTDDYPQMMRLQNLSEAQMDLLAGNIEARRRASPQGQIDLEQMRRGKAHMDEIRVLASTMFQIENADIERQAALVVERSARFERMAHLLAVALALLLLGSCILGAFYVLRRHRTEDELARARQRAIEASGAKTDFLASMSHEIRTPLNGIIGYTDLLLDQDVKPEHRRSLERIQFASAALLTVVNDILDFSKIEAGQITLEPAPFSLEALIGNTVSIISAAAAQKGLALNVVLDPQLPPALLGDEARIRQILLNLLNNALKFTPQGSITLKGMLLSSSKGDERVCFSVTDTGIGIAPDQRDKLFRRFYQVNHSSTREAGGTGLGLAISKRLVTLMGGEIGVQSQEGEGSTFWFSVPLPRAPESALSRNLDSIAANPILPGRILLVEDLEHNRDLARAILTNAGHQVDVVENGEQALAAVQAKTYDLVLMDIQMPMMDGVAATKAIRMLDAPMRNLPIIAMTANVLPQPVKGFGEAGMNDHVGKPFKKAELLQKLETWLLRPSSPRHVSGPGDPDMAVLEELRELMGRDWVERGLANMSSLIEDAFENPAGGLNDPARLGDCAHTLVSHAGLLGFGERSCSLLASACATSVDVPPAFEKARASALAAKKAVPALFA